MNRVYRLVYNRTLGVWQVASELVKAAQGGRSSGTGLSTAALHPMSFGLWLLMGWVGLVQPVTAQQAPTAQAGRIVADPSAPERQRPTVVTSANGTPQVNITTPSAAGVSRNTYSQFDVGSDGAILNNSRGNVQTQLGGWVQGNPWLAKGTARVILNEVNSANPSQLRGYVEVAGDRAQVVIANPAGISVDGGGFLNASRITLTTGTAIVNAGVLDGYRVDGGAVRVSGAGLDASDSDYTDIISRSLEVNAGIWAQQLQASLGNNVVSADHSQVSAQASSGSAAVFALDVGALGGMYANKIWLVGNEHGVGMRNAGKIGAQAGELVVTAEGRLENSGTLHAQDNARITTSAGISNSGTISAANEAKVSAAADLDNSDGTINARRVDVNAQSLRNHDGSIEQTGSQSLLIAAGTLSNRADGQIGSVEIAEAGNGGSNGGNTGGENGGGNGSGGPEGGGSTGGNGGGTVGGVTPLAAGALNIAQSLDNDAGQINALGSLQLAVSSGLDNSGGKLGVDGLQVSGGYLRNVAGTLRVQGKAAVDVANIDNSKGVWSVSDTFLLNAQSLLNNGGNIEQTATQAATWTVRGLVDNSGGTFHSNAQSLSLAFGNVVNKDGTISHAGSQGLNLHTGAFDGQAGVITTAGGLNLSATRVDHRAAVLQAQQLNVDAGDFDNRGGTVVATGQQANRITVQGTLDNGNAGTIASNGDLSLRAATLGNAGGTLQHAGTGTLSIDADTLNGQGGTLLGNGTLAITGQNTDLSGGSTSAQQISITTQNLSTAGGQLSATGNEALRLNIGKRLDNSGGSIGSNGAIDLTAGTLLNNQGKLIAVGSAASTLQVSGQLDNSGGAISSNGNLHVQAGQVSNSGGTLLAAEDTDLVLTVDGTLDNSEGGRIAAGGELSLQAGVLDNQGGTVEHAGEGTLDIAVDTLLGAGGKIIGNGDLALQGEALDLQGATTQAKRLQVTAGSLSTAGGMLVATGKDALQLKVRDALNNDRGTIAANGALVLNAGAVSNRGGTLSAAGTDDSYLQVDGALDNSQGTIASNAASLSLASASLVNEDGTISHAGDDALILQTGQLDGQRGTIASSSALTLNAGKVDHRDATLSAEQLTLDALDFDNRGGTVVATGQLASTLAVQGTLDNGNAGTIASNGDLSLKAATLGNAGGTIQHAGNGTLSIDATTLNGQGGTVLGNGSLKISSQQADLSKGTTSAQRISITATDLSNAGGQLSATGTDALHLQVGNRLDNSGGSIGSNGSIDLSAGQFINRQGQLVAAGNAASTLKVTQQLDNSGGALSSNGDLSVAAGALNNAGGTVLTADNASLQLSVDGLLDNSAGGRVAAGGDLSVAADVLDNRAGTVEHAGDGTLDITVNTLHGAGGKIIGNGDLALHGETLDLQGATTQAKRLQVKAGSLTTADGVLVSTGSDALQLQVRDALNNDRGTIAANGALALDAGRVSNRGGTISAAGFDDSYLQVGGELDNSDGTIASNAESLTLASGTLVNEDGTISHAGEGALVLQTGQLDGQRGTISSTGALQLTAGQVDHRDATLNAKQLTVNAAGFDNRGGTVLGTGQQANSITVQGTLDNGNGGTIASNGDLSLKATTLGNAGGTIQHAGSGTLSIDATTLNGQGGTLLGNGALNITGQHTDLSKGTTSAQRINITTTDLNNAGGQLSATGTEALRLQVGNRLDNSGGSIGSNGTFDVSAAAFINNKGNLQAAGGGNNRLDVSGALDNREGNILAAGNTRIDAGSIDNRAGTLHAAGDSQLVLSVDGLLDNSGKGTISSGGDANVSAAALNNAGGSIASGDALTLFTNNAIDNSAGLIQAGAALQLTSNGLVNGDGTVLGNSVSIDTRGNTLDNRNGTLASLTGALDIRSGALDNSAGLIQSAAALSINTAGQQLSNRNSGSAGGIVSAGTLNINSGNLDNRAGVVFSQGSAELHAGDIDNSDGGSLVSASNLLIQGRALANNGGEVKSGGDATLALLGALNNNVGLVAASGSLQVTATTVDNRNTGSASTLGLQAGNLRLTAQSLDNSLGQLIADHDARLQLSGQLNNSAGQVSTGGDLVVAADSVLNTGGTLVSGNDLQLDARYLSGDGKLLSQGDASLNLVEGFTNTGEVAANGKLTLTTQGALDNQSKLQGGGVEVRANSINNAANGEISSAGITHLVADGALVNRGLLDGVVNHLQAGQLDNVGSGRIYGDHVAINAGSVNNRAETLNGITIAATIAARERLDLGVQGVLSNTGQSLIFSDGDAAIGGALHANRLATGAAQKIDNLGSTIEVSGNLDIAALAVNNIRENVVVTQKVSSSSARLDQPDWWNNGSNNTNNIRNSSNYEAHEIYYLSPDDILEDTPYITPDGHVVQKAVIRVNAQTTAYFFGRGALYGAKGERSRIDLATGTMTIYYSRRQDNQSNPDQVSSGADDPFVELSGVGPGSPAFSYVSDTLTYSNAYGTCTTNCVQLTVWHAYNDPDGILMYPKRYSTQNLSGNEQYRLATHTIVEDVVQSAGPDAIIHAGGNMRIDTDALTNKYARIAAGGNLAIVGLNKAESSVDNIGLKLYRTHSFQNVSVTFGGARHSWTNPDISELTGQLGGQITAGGTLTVDVGDLSNLNDGRNPPNVQDGLSFGNVNTGGPAGGNVGPGAGQVQGPGASSGQSAGAAAGTGPQTVASNGGSGGAGTGRLQDLLGKIAAQAGADAPDSTQQSGQGGASVGGGAASVTGATAVKANGDDPAMIVAGKLNNTAPSTSLFKVDANRGQHLIETDPRFADYRNWLSSDHLLAQMGFDPVTTQKRLGDGFYEQKLVREQIGELTGRRFLDGYASDEDQYRALLEAGATVASGWGLRPGIALTAEQMAQLTSDIVWLVEQTITLADGSTTTALVPQVYLRVQPGDLADNGALLAGANVDLKLRGDFVNEGDVAGRKLVSIDAGNIRNLAGANISGQQVGLQAKQDIDIIGSTVTATDALSVKAGGNITVASTTRSWENSGSHAQSSTSIDRVAGLYVTSPSGIGALTVNAGGDVTLTGAQVINAGVNGATVLAAGGNLNLDTIAQKQSLDLTTDSRNYVRNSQTTHVGSTVSGAGNVVLQAGNDVNLNAANVNAGNAIAVQAGRDINSSVAVDVSTVDTSYAGKKASGAVSASDETVRGTQITAGGDIAMQAGRDVTLQATTVASDEGDIGVSAGRDVNLTAAQEQHDLTIDEQRKKKGFLKSKTTTTHDEWHDSIAVTTTLSGETVTVAAGRDLTSQGAQIAGTGDVLLAAGRDVVLDVAQNTHTEVHDKTVTKSGLFSGGGVGFTIGKQQTDTTADIEEKTHTGSLIGSTDGRVDIAAGRDVMITGSDVLSRDGIGIIGQNVTIQAAEDSTSVTETQKFKQAGINVSLKGGAVDTALAVKNSVERASEAKDGRLSALHAAKAGQTLFSSGGAGMSSLKGMGDQIGQAKKDVANDGQTAGGLSLRIGIGASKSSSSTEYTASTSSGSRIASEGDVVIQATGDGLGNGGDLKIIGSKVEGDNVALAAANDLILKSQQETRQQIERSKSSSGEIGITLGSEAGVGVYVAASAAKGKGDGSGTTHAETTIDAANTLTMISGRDTTLEGAQAKGKTVIADVGRDLTLISQQDSNDYKRKDVSGGIDVAVGTGGGSVSANYNQSKIDSTYTSVKEQTGIQAGDGGFDINVGGHTQLTGAAIASSADPSRNHLSTGSLSVEDLKNEAAYKASSVGISVSGSSSGGMNAPAPSVGIPQSEKASSVTRSDIAAGTVEVRNGDTAALDGLKRDVTALQQDGLKEIFDQQKVQELLEMGQVASEVGFRAAGDIAKALTNDYTEAQAQAEVAKKLLEGAGSDAERQAAQEMLDRASSTMSANQGKYDLWKEGGTGKTVLHAVTGALVAAAGGGNVLQGALGAGAAELGRPLTSDESKLVQQLVSAGIGMVAGGGTGAVAGLAGEQFNRQLHKEELDFIREKAAEYAAEKGISVADAEQQLLRGALMNNDDDWKELLTLYVSEGVDQYADAFGWLAGKAGEANMIIRDSAGVLQPAFTSNAAEKANEDLYAKQVLETPSSLKMYLDSANIKTGEASVGELMLAYLKNPGAEADAFFDGAGNALKGYLALLDPETYKSIAALAKQMANDPSGTTRRIVNGLKEQGVEVGAELMVDLMQMDLQDLRDDAAKLRGGIAVEVLAELATMGAISAATAAKYGLKGGGAVAKVANAADDVARMAEEVVDTGRRAEDILGDVKKAEGVLGRDVVDGSAGSNSGVNFGGNSGSNSGGASGGLANADADTDFPDFKVGERDPSSGHVEGTSGPRDVVQVEPSAPLSLPSPTFNVPEGYSLKVNSDGSATVIGPRGGVYNSTGWYDSHGKPIYRDTSGNYFTLDGGRLEARAPANYDNVDIHHICTDKCTSDVNGKIAWTVEFTRFFDGAGLDITRSVENLVAVPGHRGPHPLEYHQHVYGRLNAATSGLVPGTVEYREAVVSTLNRMKVEAVIPGSQINKWLTKG